MRPERRKNSPSRCPPSSRNAPASESTVQEKARRRSAVDLVRPAGKRRLLPRVVPPHPIRTEAFRKKGDVARAREDPFGRLEFGLGQRLQSGKRSGEVLSDVGEAPVTPNASKRSASRLAETTMRATPIARRRSTTCSIMGFPKTGTNALLTPPMRLASPPA